MDGPRLEISSNVEEPAVSYSTFTTQDKPPPSYEESQQHVPYRSEICDISQADKLAIYRHPLFPLLAMLFDKCEQATNSYDGVSGQAFQSDIRSFLLHLSQDGKVLMSGNEETDNLMVKAILVLKIHLLEIEKVNELCKDFCQRYIACLKSKLQTENMLRGIYTSGVDDFPGDISTDPTMSLNQVQDISGLTFLNQTPSSSTITSSIPNEIKAFTEHVVPINVQSSVQPSSLNVQDNNNVTVSTCISSNHLIADTQFTSPVSVTNQTLPSTPVSLSNISLPRKQTRRGILPKQATNIMKAWLFQHIAHPYPSEEEKNVIANQTNLTLLQVNNWFINARRRILQPMLDASNPEAALKQRKPKTTQSRSAQRFWPESLVQTIQGSSSIIQFPAQTIHIISGDLKDNLQTTIPVIATNKILPATEVRMDHVVQSHSSVNATVTCSSNSGLLTIVTNDNKESSTEHNQHIVAVTTSNDVDINNGHVEKTFDST